MPRKTKERLDHHATGVAKARVRAGNKFDGWGARPLWSIPAVRRAAKFFGLDEKRPGHRKLLLVVLADTLFGDSRRVGRPRKSTKWNPAGLVQLRDDYNEVIKDHPRISDKLAAEKIKERFSGRYQYIQADALRRRLPDARTL